MTKVKIECRSCGATGIYSGFAEPKETAVVCVECNGSGCFVFSYTPFTKRKYRSGIKRVSLSRGTFIATGVGPAGNSITYAAFKNGAMPVMQGSDDG